ncbi:MAG: hypothetical protein FH753_11165 [Firmicutes bacterium]|nr:hypothetical protein [Bacillota bacterium]
MKSIDYKKYKKIQDLFYNKRFIKRDIVCQNCGKELKVFHGSHLKKCGYSKEEYIKEFGYPNEYYEKDEILKSVIKKIEDLYVVNRNKWLILDGRIRSYVTKETEKIKEENRKRNSEHGEIQQLTRRQIKEHLLGKRTVGVFPKWNSNKFLIFDIDSYVGLQKAKVVAWHIKWFLGKYFPKNQIHVNYSGNKGYHVTLYFNEFIGIKVLYRLFTIVLNGIRAEDFQGVRVEMRPTAKGEDGYGVKLPLGVNFINRDDYNNYAYFVDEYFNEIEFEVEYVLNIKKSPSNIVWEIIDEYKDKELKEYGENYLNIEEVESINNPKYNNKNIQNNGYDKIECIIENGLEEQGTRHYWSFLIALYYKDKDIHADEAFEFLYEWSKEQIETGMSKSSIHEVVRDINSIVYKSVYNPSKEYFLIKSDRYIKDIYFTERDINKFIELNRYAKRYGKTIINHQKVLFALIIHGKTYQQSSRESKGQFYMTYDQIIELTGIRSKTTTSKCVTELDELGFIKIVERNSMYYKNKGKRDPNVYRLDFIESMKEDDYLIKISANELQDKDCFYKVMYKYFREEGLKKIFTRHIRYKVLNMDCVRDMN